MTHPNDTTETEITYGICQCGCGRPTTVATRTYTNRGVRKGERFRYILGHVNRVQVRAITTVRLTCTGCGITFDRRPKHIHKGTVNHFCSHDCKTRHSRANLGLYRGYRYVMVDGRKVFEHRIIMERILGRALMPNEVVHHINGVPTDNDPANLQVMTRSEHSALHAAVGRWAKNYDACVRCGTTLIRHGGYGHCQFCYSQHLLPHR